MSDPQMARQEPDQAAWAMLRMRAADAGPGTGGPAPSTPGARMARRTVSPCPDGTIENPTMAKSERFPPLWKNRRRDS